MLKFVIRTGDEPDRTVEAGVSPVLAGSDPSLPIVLRDPAAAPRHFEIEVRPVGVVLRDLGTESGTHVNGQLVSQVRLNAGDEVRVGGVSVVFVLQTAAPAPASAPAPVAAAPRAPVVPVPPRPVAVAPPVVREVRPPRRSSNLAVTLSLLAFVVLGGGLAFFLARDLLHKEGRTVARAPTADVPDAPVRAPEDEPAPPVDPASDPNLPPPYVPPPRVPPSEPVEPPKPVEPVPLPAAPVEIPEAHPTPADDGAALERERERRERERLERETLDALGRFGETLADRVSGYSFAGALADLESIRVHAPPGPARERALAWRADLEGAEDGFRRAKEILSAGDGRKVELGNGLTLTLTGADEDGFTAKTGAATLTYRWNQIVPVDLHGVLAEDARAAGDWLRASAFCAVAGLPAETWEEDLIRAFRADPAVKSEIDRALALRRDVPIPEGGFALFEGEWVTPEEKSYLERGYVRHEGKWLTREEHLTALGWVKHEGRWLSPEDYEKVLEAAKEAEELAAKYMPKGLLDEAGHSDSVPWDKAIELKTRHYRIRTNLSKDVARDLAYTMEILNSNLKSVFGLRGKGQTFTVNVVANREEYLANWPRAGRSLGFTSSGEICTYYQPPMTTAVLMHEGTHQILRKFAPDCPGWLHEGMATYFECSRLRFDPDHKRVDLEVGLLNAMRCAGCQRQIRSGTIASIPDFIRGKGGDPYQQGWAFVYYLAKGKDGRYASKLHEFVQEAHKRDVVERFQKIFRVRDMAAFEEEWKAFILALNPADGIRIDSPHR